MVSIDNKGELSYYLIDGQGSVRALTNTDGKVTDKVGSFNDEPWECLIPAM